LLFFGCLGKLINDINYNRGQYMDYNKVLLVGRVGKDPQTGVTKNGKQKAYFSLATHRFNPNSSKETDKNDTEWHDVTFFNARAEEVERLVRKGAMVKVEGSIHYYCITIGEKKIQKAEIWGSSIEVVESSFRLDGSVPTPKPVVTEPEIYTHVGGDFDSTLPSASTPMSFAQLAEEEN
jgi:single-strand DNA-binding protein